ncbi:MAG: hypothetical protein WD068_00040 [Candidatus Babeliales bacterium]
MRTSRLYLIIALCVMRLLQATDPIDNAHFYRPTYFWGEPRFERTHLTSFDVSLGGGSAMTGQDSCGHCVELFDIYGIHNMLALGKKVPKVDDAISKILDDITKINGNNCFGTLSIGAEFKILEAYINLYQNLSRGFFLQVNLPIRSIKINSIQTKFNPPNSETHALPPAWKTFLEEFDTILSTYHLCIKPVDKTHLGDIGFITGWSRTYQETEYLDFIDTTFKFGLLIPTGKRKDPSNLLDIPYGYNGHVGFPFYWTSSIGLFDWITLGLHAYVIPFTKRTQQVHIKTSPDQQGIIKLASTQAKMSSGALWELGAYIKADHFIGGLSMLLGYTFDKKERDTLRSITTSPFSSEMANDDIMLKGWRMHTLNVLLEYDYNQPYQRVGPRIQFFYNKVLGGKRVLNTKMLGGDFGVDVTWSY